LTRASQLSSKALDLIKSINVGEKPSDEVLEATRILEQKIMLLKNCASTSLRHDPSACIDEAKQVYRQAVILNLVSTGRINELLRTRRTAYASIALGLPTAALFGLTPLAIGLIFMGVLLTYFYFVRLKLVGWIVVLSSLMLLMPFLVNAVFYFANTLFNSMELSRIGEALGASPELALILVIVLLIISSAALALNVYSLYKLIKFRAVFGS
jgi:hypothetical protein